MTVSFQSYCIDHADDVRILAAVKRTMTDFGSVSCPVADRHSPNSALEDQQSREVADSETSENGGVAASIYVPEAGLGCYSACEQHRLL